MGHQDSPSLDAGAGGAETDPTLSNNQPAKRQRRDSALAESHKYGVREDEPPPAQRSISGKPSAQLKPLSSDAGASEVALPRWQPAPEMAAHPAALISSSLLASAADLRDAYAKSTPYPHCAMRDVFDPEVLKAVREEIVNNVQATYKETDLFKVFQTGDLGNLDLLDVEAASRLPALTAFKAALYSPQFRAFVREVTGCGELSDQTDCSCNVYAQGGHLLCHDDVIGTRRVSYIVYLTDPDHSWTAEDGGALELYPLQEGKEHTPSCSPTTMLLPAWNSMAMFTVLPGKSFHAVQEVMAANKPRMSISGWYHAADAPADASRASLQQLQLRAGEDAVKDYTPFDGGEPVPGSAGEAEMSDEDLALLVRYVNPVYLAEDAWAKIRNRFQADGSVQLQAFLKKSLATRISDAAIREDLSDGLGAVAATAAERANPDGSASAITAGGGEDEDEADEVVVRPSDHAAGMRDGWHLAGPPHKQRYLQYNASSPEAAAGTGAACTHGRPEQCGALLAQVQKELFQAPAFRRLLRRFTTLDMVGHTAEVRRFRPGLDYTVAHYGILTQDPRLDAVLCFVDDRHHSAASAWEMGEVGGFEAYLLAEEDEVGATAADVYRKDAEESGVLNVSAASNSLNLVLRDEGLMRFVKFVSARAPGSRWDVAMEYKPEDDSDSENGDGEDRAAAAE